MIDLHCHILPGLDDGPKSLEASMAMARLLAANGFSGAVATPHVVEGGVYRTSRERVESGVRELNAALAAEGLDFKVYEGAEYHLDRSLPELVRRRYPVKTMAGSLYILVELPVMQWPPYLDYSVWPEPSDPPELRKLLPFLRPVIAHPERNQEVLRDYRRLRGLREHGYLFQVNLAGLLGRDGRHTVRVIKKMAAEGLVDLVGTDGHAPEGLATMLPAWKRHAAKVLGRDRAELILEENSRRIVNNEPIELEE